MNKRKITALITALVIGTGLFVGCGNKKEVANKKVEQKVVQASKEKKDEIKKVSTEELKKKLNEENVVIVDTRDASSYIGWQLNGEKRGGHIEGAVDFSTSWIGKLEGEKLNELLEAKGIVKDKEIIIYDAEGKNKSILANKLKELGYKNVNVYDEGIKAWAEDDSLPMDKLQRYDRLVHASWINSVIKGEETDNFSGNKYKIVEVSWGDGKDYKEGHIPGAIHLDTGLIEAEPWWNRVADEDIEKVMLSLGLTHDTTVILYGADSTAAARAASIMMYAGIEDVRLLNGGYASWVDNGYEAEKGENKPEAVADFGVNVPAHPEYIIDIPEAKEILADKEGGALVSIRSWDEYIGKTSGYSYIKPMGRIKGALWGHAGSDPYHMEDFRNPDNTMRNFHEIEKIWSDWGITSDKKASFYCGTGWRASETFFYAYAMGWEDISVFDGGWYEWSGDESNPIEIGEPTK